MLLDELELLQCPYCEEPFKIYANYSSDPYRLEFGIIRCRCSEYPITNGILNLGGRWNLGVKKAIEYIRLRQFDKATFVQMEFESLPLNNRFRVIRKLAVKNIPLSERVLYELRKIKGKVLTKFNSFSQALDVVGKAAFHDYLKFRFSLPSFYKSIPLLMLIKEIYPETILDVGSGAGHYDYVLKNLCPRSKIISIDQHYLYLYLVKRYFSADSIYICCDVSKGFPLKSSIKVDMIFCCDVLKTVSNIRRQRMISNFTGLLDDDGFFIGPRLDERWLPGSRLLGLNYWVELFDGIKCEFLCEDAMALELSNCDMVSFDNAKIQDKDQYEKCRSISIIGTKRDKTWLRSINSISQKLLNTAFIWVINPIFEKEAEKDNEMIYKLKNKKGLVLMHNNEIADFEKNILPYSITIQRNLLMKGEVIAKEDPDFLSMLIRKGVAVLGIPQ